MVKYHVQVTEEDKGQIDTIRLYADILYCSFSFTLCLSMVTWKTFVGNCVWKVFLNNAGRWLCASVSTLTWHVTTIMAGFRLFLLCSIILTFRLNCISATISKSDPKKSLPKGVIKVLVDIFVYQLVVFLINFMYLLEVYLYITNSNYLFVILFNDLGWTSAAFCLDQETCQQLPIHWRDCLRTWFILEWNQQEKYSPGSLRICHTGSLSSFIYPHT